LIKTLQTTLKQDKERFKVPRSVQDIIPIRRLWPDGIFQFGSKYSKTMRFSDINYAIASKEDKTAMFLSYSELLNALDTGSTTNVTVTGTGNYTGTKTESFTIGKAKQAALSITGKPSTPIIYGQEFTLSADGGSGRGAVTWAVTSNPAYATVDNTGKVQITGVGAVAITATKAEDANYKETAATYDFTTQKAIPLVGTVSKTSPETIYPTTALADIRILYGSHIFHKTAPKHEAVPSMVRIPNNQQTLES